MGITASSNMQKKELPKSLKNNKSNLRKEFYVSKNKSHYLLNMAKKHRPDKFGLLMTNKKCKSEKKREFKNPADLKQMNFASQTKNIQN